MTDAGLSEEGKICGRCVCAIFAPLWCCLAQMPVGDKRAHRSIDRTTKCFVPNQFAENKRSKMKRMVQLHQMKESLKNKPDPVEELDGSNRINFAALRIGR